VLNDRIVCFQRELQAKKDQMESHDQRFLQEGALLRESCDQLRSHLHQHQRDAVEKDQRAVLHPQCGLEAESVKREMDSLLGTVPRSSQTLKARGQRVRSLPVHDDFTDSKLHAYLKGLDEAGVDLPSIIWRLSSKVYLLGDQRLEMADVDGQLMVRSAAGQTLPLARVLHAQAPASGYPHSGPPAAMLQTVNC